MGIRKAIATVITAAMVLPMTACANREKPSGEDKTQSESSATNSSGNYPDKPFGLGDEIPDPPKQVSMWDVLPEIPVTDASAFKYEYDSKLGGMVVTDYLLESPKVRFPDKLENEPVVKIDLNCNKELTEVIMPDTVKVFSFYYMDVAIGRCDSIKFINQPRDKETISFGGFESLESVYIPDSVTEIGDGAFSGCTSLSSVTIPDSVTEIGNKAFSGCKNLTAINVKGGNPKYYSVDGLLYERNDNGEVTLSKCPIGKSESVTISDGVTKIGDYAFDGCTNVTNITIPDSVTDIDNYAFKNCTSLTSVVIPDSVTAVHKGLSAVSFDGVSVFPVEGSIFAGCENVKVTYKGNTYDYDHIDDLYAVINGN